MKSWRTFEVKNAFEIKWKLSKMCSSERTRARLKKLSKCFMCKLNSLWKHSGFTKFQEIQWRRKSSAKTMTRKKQIIFCWKFLKYENCHSIPTLNFIFSSFKWRSLATTSLIFSAFVLYYLFALKNLTIYREKLGCDAGGLCFLTINGILILVKEEEISKNREMNISLLYSHVAKERKNEFEI